MTPATPIKEKHLNRVWFTVQTFTPLLIWWEAQWSAPRYGAGEGLTVLHMDSKVAMKKNMSC